MALALLLECCHTMEALAMSEKSIALSVFGDDRFWPRFFEPLREFGSVISSFFSPNADAVNKEGCYEIRVELPGVSEKDVEVSLENGNLTIRGEKRSEHEEKDKNYFFSERRYGAFERIFRLPDDVREADIKASYKDGILTLRLPKTESKKPASRKIEIKPS